MTEKEKKKKEKPHAEAATYDLRIIADEDGELWLFISCPDQPGKWHGLLLAELLTWINETLGKKKKLEYVREVKRDVSQKRD